ncbi:MAG: hypothetical protein HYS44_00705 [Candidatus Niyogibacteria bacterium]|nr:hypothetical protein [Candidatus Niyogibacteria bacterium]
MVLQASFTLHAFERARARLSLTLAEVKALLDDDLVVLIGREDNSPRVHRLFYSAPDQYWFVAIQDEENGEVVTVLPVDYHNAFRVSEGALNMAKEIILGPPSVPEPVKNGKSVNLFFWCEFLLPRKSACFERVSIGLMCVNLDLIGRNEIEQAILQPKIRRWIETEIAKHVPAEAYAKRLFVRAEWGKRKKDRLSLRISNFFGGGSR